MKINIIGAGISGPAAALTLTHAGHNVTVWEHRQRREVKSFGIIGILEEICSKLGAMDCDLTPHALDNLYHELTLNGMETHRMSHMKFVMWTDIHRLLVAAAERHGATFRFGATPKVQGRTVLASGLRYASARGLTSQLRYVVYRGLSSMPTDYAWLSLNDPKKRFSFKLARCNINKKTFSSWEMYVHRDNAKTYSDVAVNLPREVKLLPFKFRLITEATEELATSPISDWEVPAVLRDGKSVTVGDANGGMRPHTGMGANLGLREAMLTPELFEDDGSLSSVLLAERERWRVRGIEMGEAVMGR